MKKKTGCFQLSEESWNHLSLDSDDDNPDKRLHMSFLMSFPMSTTTDGGFVDPTEAQYSITHSTSRFRDSVEFRALVMRHSITLMNKDQPDKPKVAMTFNQFRVWFPLADSLRRKDHLLTLPVFVSVKLEE
jgi:hypothetical protein